MQIGDCLKETDKVSKICVNIYLFKKGLGETFFILSVFCVWSIEYLLAFLPYPFIGELRVPIPARFLAQTKSVAPLWRLASSVGKVNFNCNFRVTACSQAPNL